MLWKHSKACYIIKNNIAFLKVHAIRVNNLQTYESTQIQLIFNTMLPFCCVRRLQCDAFNSC